MTKLEFTQRTGIEPTDEEFKSINEMYLEAGDMDKDVFCQDFKEHRESKLLGVFYRQADNLKDKLDVMRDERNNLVDFLLERAQIFGDVELFHKAIQMVGHDKVIKRKIRKDLPLWDEDKAYIIDNIK